MPSQPTLMPLASVKTGCQAGRGGVAGAGKEQAHFAQVLAGFGKAGPALIHDMVVGEGDDFDAAGLERLRQRDRRVEHEGLGALGVVGRDRRFEVDEAEVGGLKDVGDVGEERCPALDAIAAGGGCGANGFMRNDIAGDGKADPGEFMRIGSNGRAACARCRPKRGQNATWHQGSAREEAQPRPTRSADQICRAPSSLPRAKAGAPSGHRFECSAIQTRLTDSLDARSSALRPKPAYMLQDECSRPRTVLRDCGQIALARSRQLCVYRSERLIPL